MQASAFFLFNYVFNIVIKPHAIASSFLHGIKSSIGLIKEFITISLLGKSHAHAQGY